MLEFFFKGPMFTMLCLELAMAFSLRSRDPGLSRRRMLLALVVGVGTLLVVRTLTMLVVDISNASTTIEPPLGFATAMACCAAGFGMGVVPALYMASWCHVVADTVCQLFFFSVGFLPNGLGQWKMPVMLVMLGGLMACLGYAGRAWLVDHLQMNGRYQVTKRKMFLAVTVTVMFTVLTNYQFIFWLLGLDPETVTNIIPVYRLAVGAVCLLILFLQSSIEHQQQTRHELDLVRQLWHHQQEQYRISKENIDLINQKCHDLKHQVAALRQLRDSGEFERQLGQMEQAVMIYDSVVKTGNPVLDVVLTEKSLYCEANQVNMTCMASGTGMDFIDKMDLYVLFCNALDNAIESVMKQEDPQKRVIQVSAFQEKGFLLIRVRNYCDGPVEMVDGLPATSKSDKEYHGYGLKSIRMTAEKYGGDMSVQVGDNMFALQILIPIPETAQ